MISKSDIVEAIRVQRERLRKFQSFRRDLLLSLPPLVADYALIISGIRRCGKVHCWHNYRWIDTSRKRCSP